MIIAELQFLVILMFIPLLVYLIGYLLIRRILSHDGYEKEKALLPTYGQMTTLATANMVAALNLSTRPTNLFIKESKSTQLYYKFFKIGEPSKTICDCTQINPTHHITNI